MFPARALYDYELPKRGDWQTPAYVRERRAQSRQNRQEKMAEIRRNQENFNRKNYHGGEPQRIFFEGDLVMVKDDRATRPEFSAKWLGPRRIERRLSNEVYEVARDGDVVKLHVDKLRSAPRGNPEHEEESDSDNDSSDSSLSDQEDSPEKDPAPKEDARTRGPEVTAVRPDRAPKNVQSVMKKKTVIDTFEPQPGSSRDPDYVISSPTTETPSEEAVVSAPQREEENLREDIAMPTPPITTNSELISAKSSTKTAQPFSD